MHNTIAAHAAGSSTESPWLVIRRQLPPRALIPLSVKSVEYDRQNLHRTSQTAGGSWVLPSPTNPASDALTDIAVHYRAAGPCAEPIGCIAARVGPSWAAMAGGGRGRRPRRSLRLELELEWSWSCRPANYPLHAAHAHIHLPPRPRRQTRETHLSTIPCHSKPSAPRFSVPIKIRSSLSSRLSHARTGHTAAPAAPPSTPSSTRNPSR